MDESAAVRGAIRDFIEATTAYEVCGTVDDGASALQKATERGCDLILLHLRAPVSDSVDTASLLRGRLPHVKVVGFSSVELGSLESPATAFDAVIAKQDGLSKLVETLKALMPEPPRTATNSPG